MDRVAILIDGGFYLKRIGVVQADVDIKSVEDIAVSIRRLVRGHLEKLAEVQRKTLYNLNSKNKEFTLESNWYAQHYRTFYYDAPPYKIDTTRPVSGDRLYFKNSESYENSERLFDRLRRERNLALRLGQTTANKKFPWRLKPKAVQELLSFQKAGSVRALTDEDFSTTIRQKGVDMRMGLDMATIALKKQANVFVIVTGDADFVPASKLVRREGCQVILDPMWQKVSSTLYEHIDGLVSAFANPKKNE